jgi:uncharacterized protein (TIGR02246 family)
MRSLSYVSLVFAAFVLFAGCTPAVEQVDTDAMLASAHALDETFLEAMNNGDLDAVVACYAEDAVSMDPGSMMSSGRSVIRESFAAFFSALPGGHIEILESHDLICGDAVASYGLLRITVPGPDGSETAMEGRFTDLKAERDGKWVYLLDHASFPMSMEGAE